MSIFRHKSSLSITSPYRTQVSLQHRRNNYIHSNTNPSVQATEDDIKHEETTQNRVEIQPAITPATNKYIKQQLSA
jgi:hypothetical protein